MAIEENGSAGRGRWLKDEIAARETELKQDHQQQVTTAGRPPRRSPLAQAATSTRDGTRRQPALLSAGHPSPELVGAGWLPQCRLDPRTVFAQTDGPAFGSGLLSIIIWPKPGRLPLAWPSKVAGLGSDAPCSQYQALIICCCQRAWPSWSDAKVELLNL